MNVQIETLKQQSGVVLVVSLIMLLLLTLVGVTGMQTTGLEEKMAGNMRDKNLAFQAAESALKVAEYSLALTLPTFSAAGTGGFYSDPSTPDISDAELKKDSFWTTNPNTVATSTVTELGNGIAAPRYIIQDLGCVPGGPCPGPHLYRLTVRATGGSTNTVVILQSIFQI
ncbi:PilX N-terminal domain-containing pilus assembly protein [Methylicorpusculum oleiharenae]|uniref:pilus assembly PilX family protein n=1 Tax=Methylicorpusculum oleiharenae TaxID=1338687 RepID=UPI00135AA6F9|nr:PilX N-terminal domain-containing pilus assembly protein [Methylicorpusculum oleiharenae]MCD2449274.1 PilX N-terminal domain-containing pilus assembly protein [Methylicorpusculum oleiharenae]